MNFNAGCKTAVSNIVMATAVMITLLFLTPLFYYTPLVVLSSIITAAMLGLIDYEAAIHLWEVDKFDFFVCISAYVGVVFGSVEIGLVVAVRNSPTCVISETEIIDKLNITDDGQNFSNAGDNFLAKDASVCSKAKDFPARQHFQFHDL